MRKRFPDGTWHQGTFTHCGREVQQAEDALRVSQKKYALGLQKIHLSRERRRQKDAPVTEDERGALRACVGRIAWLARNTRPDLCFGLQQIQQNVERATVTDLLAVNTLIGRALKDASLHMNFRGLRARRPEDLVALAGAIRV